MTAPAAASSLAVFGTTFQNPIILAAGTAGFGREVAGVIAISPAPMRPAEDALIIDTSALDADQVFRLAKDHVDKTIGDQIIRN